MSCSGCEARREWIKRNTERARLKLQLLLQQLSSGTNQRVSGSNSDSQHAERSHGPNHESK